ncbi:hypothetical protein [Acinetobacter sp. TSRC1-2]|uniref:hypothetical protein n=1 Tax=unclassified Acinetobacter TaxID=196816 RepID=UPI003CF9095F
MDDKKIFKLLQEWFPVLELKEIPKKKNRHSFQQFLMWMPAEKVGKHFQTYLMSVDAENPHDNGLERCAVLQHMNIDIGLTQQKIRKRTMPLYQHYEQHKQVIGKYYNVNAQAFDIVFEEIYALLKSQNFELLIIYAETAYWMAVPDQDVKIHKLCKSFSKQFKDEGICIEHYIKLDCLRST